MSFKEFSLAHGAGAKHSPGNESKAAVAADQPATQSDKKPGAAPPARKS